MSEPQGESAERDENAPVGKPVEADGAQNTAADEHEPDEREAAARQSDDASGE